MQKRITAWSTFLMVAFIACGGADGDSAEAAPEGAEVEERIFAEGIGEAKCEVLTLEDVVEATGMTAAEIEQREIGGGCHYSWGDGMVWMSSVPVHESVDRAKHYYARFSEDVTAEGVVEGKEQVKDEVTEREEAGEMSSSEAAAGGALTDALPEWDYTHTSLPGIGNEAAYDGRGTVYIRWGNLIAQFSGKKDGEDRIDPELAAEYGRRGVANLSEM